MQSKIDILETELKAVFENNKKVCPPLTDDTPLDSTFGLDSLDWAEFAVRYQKKTGVDIFEDLNLRLKTYSDLKKLAK